MPLPRSTRSPSSWGWSADTGALETQQPPWPPHRGGPGRFFVRYRRRRPRAETVPSRERQRPRPPVWGTGSLWVRGSARTNLTPGDHDTAKNLAAAVHPELRRVEESLTVRTAATHRGNARVEPPVSIRRA